MKTSCFLWFSHSFSQHSDYWIQSRSNSKYIFLRKINFKNFGQGWNRHLPCSGQERRSKGTVNRKSSIASRARCVLLHKFRIWRYPKTFLARGNFYFLQIWVSQSEIFEFVAVIDWNIDTVKIFSSGSSVLPPSLTSIDLHWAVDPEVELLIYQLTWCDIPEELNVQKHGTKNLKFRTKHGYLFGFPSVGEHLNSFLWTLNMGVYYYICQKIQILVALNSNGHFIQAPLRVLNRIRSAACYMLIRARLEMFRTDVATEHTNDTQHSFTYVLRFWR